MAKLSKTIIIITKLLYLFAFSFKSIKKKIYFLKIYIILIQLALIDDYIESCYFINENKKKKEKMFHMLNIWHVSYHNLNMSLKINIL